jgi:hypothetical protein
LSEEFPSDDPQGKPVIVEHRQVVGSVVDERGIAFLMAFRKRHPALDPEELVLVAAHLLAGAFRMHDALSCGHEIEFARSDRDLIAQRIPVHDLAIEKKRHRRQSDVRMGAHIQSCTGQKFGRSGLVEEDEWPDHLPLGRGQGTAHLEVAKVAGTRNDDGFNRIAGACIAEGGIQIGQPSHGVRPFVANRVRQKLAADKAGVDAPRAGHTV